MAKIRAKSNKLKNTPKKDIKSKKKSLNFDFSKISKSLNDERVPKIVGLLLILLSFYLLIAFTSFVFSWKIDHDKISNASSSILMNPDVKVENWLGKFGALTSHKLIQRGFGLGSYAFVLIIFVFGIRFLTKIAILPIKRTLGYSLFAIVWISVTLAYLFNNFDLNMGGTFGYQVNVWLNNFVGSVGSGLFVWFTAFAFLIYAFNPSFDFLKSKEKEFENENDEIFDNDIADNLSESRNTEDDLEGIELKVKENPSLAKENNGKESIINESAEKTKLSALENDLSNNINELISEKKDEKVEEKTIELETTTPEPKPIISSTELEMDVSVPESEVELAVEVIETKEEVLPDNKVDENTEKKMVDYDPTLDLANYQPPTIDLLVNYEEKFGKAEVTQEELEQNKNKIIDTLKNYNIDISKIKATVGPTITLYEIIPAPGVRISKIKNLEDDIALSLAALGIRIIAPIPGKGTIGIEVPNAKPSVVSMRSVVASEKFQNIKAELPVVIGKTITNDTFTFDLAKAPHLLVAGATGQGKSVGLNAILTSLLYKKHPSQLKFVMVDPKMVEFSIYDTIKNHFLAQLPDADEPILTDSKKVINTLNSLVIEMENRLILCKKANARNIIEYNKKFISRKLNPNNGHKFLPYIVVVIDEFADFIMEAGKEIETPIARLAQKARAIGIHLIIATQRPSATVITGIIKANFPSRIAFRVSSAIDSRVILDAGGANQLIGKGDMLYSAGQDMVRIQCALVETEEVEEIVNCIGQQRGYPEIFELPEYVDENSKEVGTFDEGDRDLIFDDAARMVVETSSGSTSMIQRKFKLGYNRAGRIMDQLEASGIVGPARGSKPREVLMDSMTLEQFLNNTGETI